MIQKESRHMTSVAFIMFLFGAGALFMSVFIYSKSDHTAFTKTLETIKMLQAKVLDLEKLINSNIQTVANSNLKVEKTLQLIEAVEKTCEELNEEAGELQEICRKLREKDIELQEKISLKRTTVRLAQPLPVQILTNEKPKPLGKGVKSLFKTNNMKDQ